MIYPHTFVDVMIAMRSAVFPVSEGVAAPSDLP